MYKFKLFSVAAALLLATSMTTNQAAACGDYNAACGGDYNNAPKPSAFATGLLGGVTWAGAAVGEAKTLNPGGYTLSRAEDFYDVTATGPNTTRKGVFTFHIGQFVQNMAVDEGSGHSRAMTKAAGAFTGVYDARGWTGWTEKKKKKKHD